jgi:glycolate oxidase FAD binding subunit
MSPEPSELQELVRELHRQATPWLPAGCASRLTWGPPVQPGPGQTEPLVLSTARLDRIVEHSPGDFTVTVQAGMPLDALQAALANEGQWLALDRPWGSGAGGSAGGLVARGLAGGYRQRYLGVRDQLIGIALMRADGTAARAGGRVVKNVAGYDLMRLLCGSWGSLALITEVTLRTLPLPPLRQGLELRGSLERLGPVARWLLGSSLSPERIDWRRRAGGAEDALLVSLAGIQADTLGEQLRCLEERATEAGVGAARLSPEALARRLEDQHPSGGPDAVWLLRLGVQPAQVQSLLADPALAGIALEMGAGSGLGWAWAPAASLQAGQVEGLRRRCSELGGHLRVLLQPTGCAIPAWLDAPSRPLIEAIKRQFDPKQQLARGRLPGIQPQG